MRIFMSVGDKQGPKPAPSPDGEEEEYIEIRMPDDMTSEKLRSMSEDEACRYFEELAGNSAS